MGKIEVALFALTLGLLPLDLKGAPPAAPAAPALLPGEGLAMADPEGRVFTYGETRGETPMGGLAKLLWISLEGDEWAPMRVQFRCTGEWMGHRCSVPKGHGRLDLEKALREDCNLAFLGWVQMSSEFWKKQYGEAVARVRMEEVFGPFLGKRLPSGDSLPAFGLDWVGDGDLLRTSPEAMLRWMIDPHQEEAMGRCRRLLLGFVGSFRGEEAWWVKTATAPVAGAQGETLAWVAGSNGSVSAVLRLPRGKGALDGVARFRAILGLPAK